MDTRRIGRLILNQRFLERVFTPGEVAYINKKGNAAAQTAAGIFCAKEAFVKALGTGFSGIGLADVEVCRRETGAPYIACAKKPGGRVHLTISHCREYATAVVVLED